MVIYLPLLVALIGLLMYVLCVQPKLATIGLVMFGAGLLAFLMGSVPHLVGVIK